MDNKDLETLMKKDFSLIINDLEKFIEGIPRLAKITGLEQFYKEMGFTHAQYYRRVKNPNVWTLEELKKAVQIFQKFNIGVNK